MRPPKCERGKFYFEIEGSETDWGSSGEIFFQHLRQLILIALVKFFWGKLSQPPGLTDETFWEVGCPQSPGQCWDVLPKRDPNSWRAPVTQDVSDMDTWAVGEKEGVGKGAGGVKVRGERRAVTRGRGQWGGGRQGWLSHDCPSVWGERTAPGHTPAGLWGQGGALLWASGCDWLFTNPAHARRGNPSGLRH